MRRNPNNKRNNKANKNKTDTKDNCNNIFVVLARSQPRQLSPTTHLLARNIINYANSCNNVTLLVSDDVIAAPYVDIVVVFVFL